MAKLSATQREILEKLNHSYLIRLLWGGTVAYIYTPGSPHLEKRISIATVRSILNKNLIEYFGGDLVWQLLDISDQGKIWLKNEAQS